MLGSKGGVHRQAEFNCEATRLAEKLPNEKKAIPIPGLFMINDESKDVDATVDHCAHETSEPCKENLLTLQSVYAQAHAKFKRIP